METVLSQEEILSWKEEFSNNINKHNLSFLEKARFLEEFIARKFHIEEELYKFRLEAEQYKLVYYFKRNVIARSAIRKYSKSSFIDYYNKPEELEVLYDSGKGLIAFVQYAMRYFEEDVISVDLTESIEKYCAYKVYYEPDSILFYLPSQLDYSNLLESDVFVNFNRKQYYELNEANYCIFCHNQSKDSCRKGIIKNGIYSKNLLNNELRGCPLGQKISEMNALYSEGRLIAALSVAMVDNPLIVATGDRICNDCMKSCIYQKQTQVDVPAIETDLINRIFSLPFGIEIYYFLAMSNPLSEEDLYRESNIGKKILVVGMGPSGFTMAYYKLLMGYSVVGIDALQIVPLPEVFLKPIKNWENLKLSLGKYKSQGFGGVAEYGITDRWDKYNLLIIRMILERNSRFTLKGNCKLGKDLILSDILDNNQFSYIALCLGAGRAKIPDVQNIQANGVFSAFNFLASLHLGIENFSYQMPVVIVGAGLTAMDCAMAAGTYSEENSDISILYRKDINSSPSYKENHRELAAVLGGKVKFYENIDLESIEIDENNNIISVNGYINAKTLVYSIGTEPNHNILIREKNLLEKYQDKIGVFGDMNPQYAGTVVKAIASVKDYIL